MYIDKVRLTNIRGFRDLEFSFDRGNGTYAGWTVLTGDNGSGKSTLLKAMALSLIGLRATGGLQPSFRRWVRSGEPRGVIAVDCIHGQQKRFDVAIRLLENDGHTEPTSLDSFGPVQKEQIERKLDRPHDWFSCGYGPFRRVSNSSPEAHALMAAPVAERFVTMFQESASLAETDQWLRQLNYKRLEGKTAQAQTLELVISILNDEFLPNQIEVDRIDSDGLWLKDRNGVELSWGNMSDGYRSALALLSDILRHLVNHYGIDDLTARDADGKLFITRSGVVLIDEIDAHLHPEWQREIGFWLKKHFPNIQFIVTSHSPLVCQAADANGLFVLPEPGSGNAPRALSSEERQRIISSTPDTILRSPAFGLQNTRSEPAVQAQAKYSKLKAKQRAGAKLSPDEQGQLTQLSLFIPPDEES